MTTPRDSIQDVRRWVEKAENDLRNAENTLKMKADCPLDTVCFHAQQCAEKYLKALLVLRGSEFPRTHDLMVLLNRLPKNIGLRLDAKDIHPLDRYSVEARYPGGWEPIDRKEAEDAVSLARKTRDAVRVCLPKEATC
jgi:HEPN domain-containing protein